VVNKISQELIKIAKEISSAKSYVLKKDTKTKNNEFEQGTVFTVVEYTRKYPYWIKMEDSQGRVLVVPPDRGYRLLNRFPKPPSPRQMEKWMMDGVAKSIDGKRVEPDGFSPSGAPSWLLVLGMI